MVKKILKLESQNDFDFLLFAIICSFKDYRLCFELNGHLKIKLKREKDMELIMDKQKNRSFFSSYLYTSSMNEIYRVINNKSGIGAFIPEKKNIDYFLIIKNMPSKHPSDAVLQQLKKIEIISGVYEMDPTTLKSAENFLIFE